MALSLHFHLHFQGFYSAGGRHSIVKEVDRFADLPPPHEAKMALSRLQIRVMGCIVGVTMGGESVSQTAGRPQEQLNLFYQPLVVKQYP